MEIKQTTDYALFEPISGNRNLSQAKIDKIVADVKAGFNMLQYVPIIVVPGDGKLRVIDGQHRKEVSRITGNPVYYVECTTLTLKQIAKLNSRSEKWKVGDFLNCYIALGIPDYITLKEVATKYRTSITVTADLLMFLKVKEKQSDAFQDGEFKVKYLTEVTELLNITTALFGRYVFSTDRNLIAAVQAIDKKGLCDFGRLKEKIAGAPNVMEKQKDMKNYIYNMEIVYNHGKSKRDVIY